MCFDSTIRCAIFLRIVDIGSTVTFAPAGKEMTGAAGATGAAFAGALADGRTVQEFDPNGAGTKEFQRLAEEILARL